MSQIPTVCDVYNVMPTPENRIRLEMIIHRGSFPDFAVDLPLEVAERISMALLANVEILRRKKKDPIVVIDRW